MKEQRGVIIYSTIIFIITAILLIILYSKGESGYIKDIVIGFFSSSIMTIFIAIISYESKISEAKAKLYEEKVKLYSACIRLKNKSDLQKMTDKELSEFFVNIDGILHQIYSLEFDLKKEHCKIKTIMFQKVNVEIGKEILNKTQIDKEGELIDIKGLRTPKEIIDRLEDLLNEIEKSFGKENYEKFDTYKKIVELQRYKTTPSVEQSTRRYKYTEVTK